MLIIDAHLDLAYNALVLNRDLSLEVGDIRNMEANIAGRGHGTVSLPELRRGRVAVAVGTIFDRTERPANPAAGSTCQEISYGKAQGQLAYYHLLEAEGKVRILGDAAALQEHMAAWQCQPDAGLPMGLIPAIEGADPIVWPEQVHAWREQGVRVVSLAHYGLSAYAHGNASEGGLTPAGLALLKEMAAAKVILDVSHLNDQSFFEALEHFAGSVMASHTNCRALVPGERQHSDDQIKTLLAHNGVMGIVVANWMLHAPVPEGQSLRDAITLEAIVDQIDHVCQLAGNAEHVAMGTDLDGGYGYESCPKDLDTIADLQKLPDLLRRRGYPESAVEAVMHGNWTRFFVQAWK